MKSTEPEKIKIFIAFADEDRDVRDKLWRQMNLVKHRQGWEIWSDMEIKAGEQWDTQIKQRLSESDVVVLLLSTDFFNSAYIMETELPEAITKHTKGNCQIIPVIARKCHWKETAFGDYAQLGDIQALPAGEKPIISKTLWDNEDDPYFETVQGIKESIAAFRAAKNKKPEGVTNPAPEKPETVDPAPAPKKTAPVPQKQVSQKSPQTSSQNTGNQSGTNKQASKPTPQPAKTTLLDDIVNFFGDAQINSTNRGSLFPLYKVTLGKTTVEELKQLGVHGDTIDESTQKPYKHYVIQGTDFWYDRGIAERMYLTKYNKMPEKWKNIGFDWALSYNDWLNLLRILGYKVAVTKTPKIVPYNGNPSLEAQITAHYTADGITYRIDLGFNYSKFTQVTDKATLYNLRVSAE